ncbi:sortase domain-containing protein [Streptomyces sp. NPDC001770]
MHPSLSAVVRRVPRAVVAVAAVLAVGSPAAVAAAPSPGVPAAVGSPVSSGTPSDRTDPRTEAAGLAIPAIGVTDLRVVPYEGTTDDTPGTRIQDGGVAASPYGDGGGVGPGEIGNYLVTAHRLSAGGPLRDLPSLGKGDAVLVTEDGTVYEYRITETRETSFRSTRSLAEQRAEVPGKPGEKPARAMITISTCATPEDDAAGNHWRDAHDNPEHRIDKIGVLVSVRSA